MNRLAPLISRPVFAVTGPAELPWDGIERRRPDPLADLKQFLVFWLGGVVFFGTFLA